MPSPALNGVFTRSLSARARLRAPEHVRNIRGIAGENVLVYDPALRHYSDEGDRRRRAVVPPLGLAKHRPDEPVEQIDGLVC